MNRSKNVNLKSLSQELGLHVSTVSTVSTVSRILNSSIDYVSSATAPEPIEKVKN
ncbi:hypothetical protein D3C80_214560 [compost metagenome]